MSNNDIRPPVVGWYRLYCLCLTAMYVLLTLAGAGMVGMVATGQVNGAEEGNVMMMGAVYGIMGCGFAMIYGLLPFVLPRQSGAWVVHLVLICLTLTSCCCIPFAILLLIGWFKAETRAYFNMST